MSCLEVKVQRNQHAQVSGLEIHVEDILFTQWHVVLEANT